MTLVRTTLALVFTKLIFCSASLYAQGSVNLSDWGVLDPWESSCESTELSNAEEKLYQNICSKAFTWFTGTKEQAHYEPIGELANYFGFANLRNEIREASNDPLADENLRGASWVVVLENLDSTQRAILYKAAKDQETAFFGFLEERVALIDMLYGLKDDNAVNLSDALDAIEAMGEYEAEISIISAEAFGSVSLSLASDQKELFTNIRQGNLIVSNLRGTGPYTSVVPHELDELSSNQRDLITETASKFLSYETGTLEDAIFLPPGKIGNYFGFASYRYEERASVSRSQAADLLLSVLTDDQKEVLKCLTTQVSDFEQTYINARAELITDVYPLKSGDSVDESSIVDNYLIGATAEGQMGVVQAIYFDYLGSLLNEGQISELKTQRANTGDDPTAVDDVQASPIRIGNNYPNPFKNYTRIRYELNQPAHVVLKIYDMQGQKVAELVNGQQNAGAHEIQWEAERLGAGTYICVFQLGNDLLSISHTFKKLHKI
ncbi:MAG: T9SS type A sorting domain-containing protein [Saprospiraceae bacterium]|nr:T9SS type A sorting domain-containing protein [Saprospiraceae bacterium]